MTTAKMSKCISFRVLAIARRSSSEVNTFRYKYDEGEERKSAMTSGGEWEEIEFGIVEEEKPTIQIANVSGDGFLPAQPVKLIINNPDLFGTYKVGDIIEFTPQRLIKPLN